MVAFITIAWCRLHKPPQAVSICCARCSSSQTWYDLTSTYEPAESCPSAATHADERQIPLVGGNRRERPPLFKKQAHLPKSYCSNVCPVRSCDWFMFAAALQMKPNQPAPTGWRYPVVGDHLTHQHVLNPSSTLQPGLPHNSFHARSILTQRPTCIQTPAQMVTHLCSPTVHLAKGSSKACTLRHNACMMCTAQAGVGFRQTARCPQCAQNPACWVLSQRGLRCAPTPSRSNHELELLP